MDRNEFKINPMIPLAINLADERKRFVLFCGAGISKESSISSGHDILIDTLGKIYQQEHQKETFTAEEIEKWYQQKEDLKDMTYSEVLDLIYPGMEQKRLYLNNFFGGKLPGESHKAIAKMVKLGLIRFIVTTNFDNLIEKALDLEGLNDKYSVISTNDQARNSDSWDKVEFCRVYKIHGDKDQGPIRNSPKELEKLDEYLERDFQELINRHGVIILGYAGEDEGVIRCFERREYHRYPIYWQYRTDVNKRVENMIFNQDGVLIKHDSASGFLIELLDRIERVRRSSETDTVETIKSDYEQIIIRNNPLEIKARIEDERNRYLKDVCTVYESIGQSQDWKILWDSHIDLIERGSRNIILAEQILRFEMGRDWGEFIKFFEALHFVNKDGDRHGRNGLINYLFFTMFLIIGSRALKYERFSEIKKLFSLKNIYRDRIEYILGWNIQASYIEQKNQSEPNRFHVPNFHYLLGILPTNIFPFADKNDLERLVLEFDLLCFVYATKNPISGHWYPRCVYYFRYEAPQFLQKIKFDEEYCERIAKYLFDETKDVLKTSLAKVNEAYVSLSSRMPGWPDNPFESILR
jgi:hypothetical protein